ncbi:MAG: cupin domain-containing protein [Treponema sp.]|jgi:mannose-6-phosphate isomerase-like protein (cupin superfamily)|nr:cupin domain-containing protein [Treponema sp.]
MIVRKTETRLEEKPQMRGGVGTASLYHYTAGDPTRRLRFLAEINLPPGASIGYHQHCGETEYFYFREGAGLVNDNGSEYPVGPGDLLITGGGASHGVRNTGDKALVFGAIIITD